MHTSRTAAGAVLKAILAHVSNLHGGDGVTLHFATMFLDEHPELEALDAAMLFSGDGFVSSTWLDFRQLDAGLRLSMLARVRADLASAPAESFVPHAYIPILTTNAA